MWPKKKKEEKPVTVSNAMGGSPWGYANQAPQSQLSSMYANASGGSLAGLAQAIYGTQGLASEAAPISSIDPHKLEALKRAEPRKVLRPIPEYVAPLVAWRAWGCDGDKLTALAVSGPFWEPKKATEAHCSYHKAPNKSCSCGFWSFSSLEKLIEALPGYQTQIIGQVSIWGRVIECENGYRSQFAYPKELWLLDESLEQLGYIYGVPVRTVEVK